MVGNYLSENKIDISVIIPTLNRAIYLKKTLNSILFQNFSPDRYEIIIIDGGSSDTTKEICNDVITQFPNHSIYYIYEPEPGLLSGRHRGVRESCGEILVFVDDDIEATEGWLSAIYRTFKDPTVQIVGGKNLPKYEIEPPYWIAQMWTTTQYGGRVCGYLSLLDLGDEQLDIHPNYVWGLNFSIRKDVINTLGGFHPDTYPKYLQRFQGDGETGLTMKAFEKGCRAVYQPNAKIFHIIPAKRLTIKYFENRMFFQGVCRSYYDLRKECLINNKNPQSSIKYKELFAKKFFTKFVRNQLLKIQSYFKNPTEIREINRKMKKSYIKGYQFHRNEVKNDPELFKWVLKENYWDYNLSIQTKKRFLGANDDRCY